MNKPNNQFPGLPSIGLGTWKMRPEEARAVIPLAIRMGYRHLDCASTYGNEKAIGEALQELIEEGVVGRNELWITSKLPNTAHAPKDVQPALEKSLQDLGIEYLDAYLMHWPVALRRGVWIPRKAGHLVSLDEQPLEETWAAMEKLPDNGSVRHLGVCNFSMRKLDQLLSACRVRPVINQVESHPYLQQEELLRFCRDRHIQLVAYSPLGSGDRPKPLRKKNEPVLLEDPVIERIATEHGIPSSQVLLAWALKRETSTIPKSVDPNRLQSNLDAQSVELTDNEMAQIGALERHYRYVDGSFWVLPNGPYTLSDLWDE